MRLRDLNERDLFELGDTTYIKRTCMFSNVAVYNKGWVNPCLRPMDLDTTVAKVGYVPQRPWIGKEPMVWTIEKIERELREANKLLGEPVNTSRDSCAVSVLRLLEELLTELKAWQLVARRLESCIGGKICMDCSRVSNCTGEGCLETLFEEAGDE